MEAEYKRGYLLYILSPYCASIKNFLLWESNIETSAKRRNLMTWILLITSKCVKSCVKTSKIHIFCCLKFNKKKSASEKEFFVRLKSLSNFKGFVPYKDNKINKFFLLILLSGFFTLPLIHYPLYNTVAYHMYQLISMDKSLR